MARVFLTPRAEADLFEVWAGIAPDNPAAADGVLRRIMHKVDLAADNPMMGAARPELSPSARILVEGRYIVIYEPSPDGVLVVAVVHGMRDPASWLE
ncbi:MAG: type II toxin-antitoxin system RelE/ParE family toxin [Rhodoplanes sp.]|uniref:type II toxin-antitoxin system RelE/ParE family toxin n=1 Tax=Rhodoplanes sp. TaxID=1968906 RepID=UPI00181871A2|nr:type II toxin-antitoxin system RelE/ParE family toxin [Rhodoplanes sp.]NVO13266.1 type II toxin-antitoxin system RelE/ParE family toxin [Rhodoplanes sp.]